MASTVSATVASVEGRRPSSARAALNGRDDQDCAPVTGSVIRSSDEPTSCTPERNAHAAENTAREFHDNSVAARLPRLSIDDVPDLPALAVWRVRAAALVRVGGTRLPLMTPEQAMVWTGDDLETLCRKTTHFRDGRTLRFFPELLARHMAGEPAIILSPPKAAPPKKPGKVYIIEAIGTGRVKIGCTDRDPDTRRRQLQCASPVELRVLIALPGTPDLERRLHQEHKAERVLPTAEWFHHRGSVADLVRQVLATRCWP